MKKLMTLLLILVTGSHLAANAAPHSSHPVEQQKATFVFHSAFLMNLHHFLYDMALHKDKLARVEWQVPPSADDIGTLQEAIDFYRRNYASRDILFDPAMTGIKQALSAEDRRQETKGLALPPGLAEVLGQAAPIYAKSLWPLHDQSNLAWIGQAKVLDAKYGNEVQAGIERHMGAPFPSAPIRVDLVFDTGSRQGAYTDEQVVIPSARADYQQFASLEMLYHEASHTTVTTALEDAIGSRLTALGRNPDNDLWHVVQFYTVGAVTQEVLARHGEPGYRPYADKRGLYSGFWSPFMPAIHSAWREHMAGKIDLRQAAQKMVDQLPAD